MDSSVIVALLALLGTIVGTGGGIVVSARLTNYRIEQLEKKVDKHNNFAERVPILEEKLSEIVRRVDELEKM